MHCLQEPKCIDYFTLYALFTMKFMDEPLHVWRFTWFLDNSNRIHKPLYVFDNCFDFDRKPFMNVTQRNISYSYSLFSMKFMANIIVHLYIHMLPSQL